jgi:hypothetical protein
MFLKINRYLLIGLFFLISFCFFNTVFSAYGLEESKPGSLLGVSGSASATIASKTGIALGTILSFVGAIFLVLMIAGGLIWMTSAGNDSKVQTAKNLIIAAVIGLVIVLAAYAIVSYVGEIVT